VIIAKLCASPMRYEFIIKIDIFAIINERLEFECNCEIISL